MTKSTYEKLGALLVDIVATIIKEAETDPLLFDALALRLKDEDIKFCENKGACNNSPNGTALGK